MRYFLALFGMVSIHVPIVFLAILYAFGLKIAAFLLGFIIFVTLAYRARDFMITWRGELFPDDVMAYFENLPGFHIFLESFHRILVFWIMLSSASIENILVLPFFHGINTILYWNKVYYIKRCADNETPPGRLT